MNSGDVEAVVKVHLSSFPGFFLSFLGPRFLSLFYLSICSAPEGIAFVYLNHASVPVGFVAGTSNPGGFYSSLLKREWYKFARASIIPILRKPSAIKRILRAVSHPSNNPIGDDVAGLFSIGIIASFLYSVISMLTGGRHFYFAHPAVPVPNFVGLLPGIDVRGDGGGVGDRWLVGFLNHSAIVGVMFSRRVFRPQEGL